MSLNFSNDFEQLNKQDWIAEAVKSLKGQDLSILNSNTYEGIELQAFYSKEDLEEKFAYLSDFNTEKVWKNRVEIREKEANKANQLGIEALNKGADAVQFDLWTMDDPQFEKLLQNIDLNEIDLGFTLKSATKELIEKLKKYTFKGNIRFDFLSHWTLRGEKPADAFEQLADLVDFAKEKQDLKVIVVKGQHFHNAGGNAVQELAFSLASAVEYLHQLSEKGFVIETLSKQVEFSLAIGSNYFMEIAKFRALRLLWNFLMQNYGLSQVPAIVIHARTSQWNKTRSDIYVNMLRSTTEAMSALIGGCSSLTVAPYNEGFAEVDEFSSRIARNIPIILKEEAYLDKVKDVSAGSYYLEKLSYQLAEKSWELFRQVEAKGGFIAAFESGFIQNEIEKTAALKRQNFKEKKDILVGTNKYENKNEKVAQIPESQIFENKNLKLLKTHRLSE